MPISHKKLLILLLPAVLLLSGCSVSLKTGASEGAVDGGVFKTTNKGETWTQATRTTLFGGKGLDIRGLDVNVLAIDPSDPRTIYLGSLDNGLFFTYDEGADWQVASRVGKIMVSSLAVDPNSKCVIYLSSGNQAYKSVDCGRFWRQAYFDNDPAVQIRSIAINPLDSGEIFISTSRGEVIKSRDGGETWRTTGRLETDVVRIIVSPHDPKIIFAGTVDQSIFRSTDGGENWSSQKEILGEFRDSNSFRDLVFSLSDPGTVFLANHYGLIKSTDYGDSWVNINLITPKEEAIINAIAVSPENSGELYYVTATTFYHSTDGGANWSSKQLPSSRAGFRLAIDPESPNIIYLGMRKF